MKEHKSVVGLVRGSNCSEITITELCRNKYMLTD